VRVIQAKVALSPRKHSILSIKVINHNNINKGRAASATAEPEVSEEETYNKMESAIQTLVEESAMLTATGKPFDALEKAKEAAKKERLLTKQREQANLIDQLNLDLTYVVLLNLAHQYEMCNLLQEALNTLTIIVKNKAFNQAGRLRVNMGNIYFTQGKYTQAIKMYRMALDQIPAVNKNIRFKILRNIGQSFVKMGKYQDAVTAFESVMENHPDHQAAYNLILCHYSLGDKENMKKGFMKMTSVAPPIIEQYVDNSNAPAKKDEVLDSEVFAQDALRQLAIDRRKKIERYVLLSTKLISPAIDSNFANGFSWAIDTVRSSPMAEIASELEIAKAMQYVKMKEYQQAIEALKGYEKKGQRLVGTAATNISFLYFLEGEYKLAEKYSEIAIKADRYNAKALNNRGNCYYIRDNYEKAIECYKEAVTCDSLCIEAIYNAGKHIRVM
jgi:intraflagellar transport protein 88